MENAIKDITFEQEQILEQAFEAYRDKLNKMIFIENDQANKKDLGRLIRESMNLERKLLG